MNNLSRKAVAVGLSVATVAWAAGAALSVSAAGLSESQVQAILSLLQSFGADQSTIANVQAALTGQSVSGTSSGSTASTSGYTFSRDLTLGSRGADVKALQQFLNSKGFTVAESGAGSPGNETEYFGPATKAALAKFQAANNISPAVGYFGPKTRAVVNPMTAGTGTTTTGGVTLPAGFNVSLASDTPSAGTVVAGQTAADLAHFTFSNGTANPVTVTSLTVTRIGVSSDNSLLNTYLYVGNNRVTDGSSVVNGKVTFTNSSGLFTVPANSTVTVSVRSDIVSGISGQTVSFSIASASDVVASGVTVGGTFPVNGNLANVANVSDLATAQTTGTPNGAGSTINAGTMNAIVWSQPLNVSQRTVYLKYVRFRQIGSVQSDALQNIGLYVDGTKVGSGALGTDGTVVFDMTASPVSLNTGAHVLELHADIVKGSSRTFSFSIQTPSDIVITDSNYGVNLSVSGTFPMSSSQTTIQSGSISITTDPDFTATQVLSSASNVTLGQWTATAYGEDMRVGQLKVQIQLTGTFTSSDYINNIAVYVNGAQVGTTQKWTTVSTDSGTREFTFGSGNLTTLYAGQKVVIAVKGDTSLNSDVSTVRATVKLPVNQAQGLSSYTTYPDQEGTYAGQTLSFVSGALQIAANPSYSNQTIAANTPKQKIASYILQATNADSVQVTQVKIGLGVSSGTQYLSNLYISDNQTPVFPQSQNTFSVNFTIAPNQSHTIDVYADIGNFTGTVTTTLSVTARAVTSNAQVAVGDPATGQTITVGSGTIGTPTLVQSKSKSSQYVVGGTSGEVLATYNFVASGGAATIQELYFNVTSSVASTSITQVSVAGVPGSVFYAPGASTGTVTISGLSLNVPGNNYAGLDVPVSVTYASIGPSGSPSGVTTTLALTGYKYVSGGNVVKTTTLDVAANTVMLVSAYPTISVANTSVGGLSIGENKLFEFTVGAVGNQTNLGQISIATTTFTVSASGITSSSLDSVRIAINNTTVDNSNCTSTDFSGGTSTVTCYLGNYTINAGNSVTFSLFGNIGGTLGSAGQSAVTTKLGPASTFEWRDVSGAGAGSTPYSSANTRYLYNYPTNTWTVKN